MLKLGLNIATLGRRGLISSIPGSVCKKVKDIFLVSSE